MQVHDSACPSETRPSSEQTCPGPQSCALWTPGPWSQCSVACGLGLQTRNITCVDLQGQLSSRCIEEKPKTWRQCLKNQLECREENSGWNHVIDNLQHSVYIDKEGQEQVQSFKLDHKMKFLESTSKEAKVESVFLKLCAKLLILCWII